MIKQSLLYSAIALTLTACGPEKSLQVDLGSNTSNTPTSTESDNTNSGTTDSGTTDSGTTDSGTTDSGTTDSSSIESDLNADLFLQGQSYLEDEQVQHNGSVYECVVGGWCSSGAQAYVPGEGFAWSDAWRLVGDSSTGSTDSSTGSTDTGTDSTDTGTGTTDTGSGTGTGSTDIGTGSTDPTQSDGSYSTDLDMTGWPKPLQEKNEPFHNNSGKVVGTYFVEWGVYGRDYHVADIPAQNLTHILYGFIPICGPNASMQAAGGSAYSALVSQCADKQDYEVVIHDEWAATGIAYPGDTWDQEVKGNFGQMMRMKASNPDLKILPSVGGWTLSDPFFDLDNSANRATFVASVKDFLLTWDFFDGVDIDWEFPGGGGASAVLGKPSDAQTYAILMRDLRVMLDEIESETGRDMELSSAIGTSPRFIQAVDYATASQYMDYIFMMNYDFKGAWSSEVGHQTNLFASQMTADDSLSVEIAVNELLKQNVDPGKLVVGIAKYGRGWGNVTGVTGNNPFEGSGGEVLNESGYWEAGIMDYKLIEERYLGGDPEGQGINGWVHGWDDVAQAPYLWNASEKKLISFDNTRSTIAKGQFVLQNNLGGMFSWEIDGDNGSILNAMNEGLGHTAP